MIYDAVWYILPNNSTISHSKISDSIDIETSIDYSRTEDGNFLYFHNNDSDINEVTIINFKKFSYKNQIYWLVGCSCVGYRVDIAGYY